jgi:glycosyltransferase involved in cell wall biosynthesis
MMVDGRDRFLMSAAVDAKKLKVLWVLPANVIGGAETVTYNLLQGLHSLDCALLTQAPIAGFFNGLRARCYHFEHYGCLNPYLLSAANILLYARAVSAVARREKPDLLLGIMHNGTLFASIAKRMFFLKPTVIGTILGNVSAYFSRIGREPTRMERWIIHTCVTTPLGIIAPSRGIIDDLVENHRACRDKLELIYNGIDIADLRRAAQITAPSIDKTCPWIVSACRLSVQKDFATLLAAFKAVRANRYVKLVLVGDGELRDEISRIADDMGVGDDLVLTGFQVNPFPYIARADVFLLSSFFEGFGNVIVEAMALGVPVVATDCPSGPAEIIREGEDGFLVPLGDWEAMAARCLLLLDDTERRAGIIQSGIERSEHFELATMLAAYDRYLMAIAADRTGIRSVQAPTGTA